MALIGFAGVSLTYTGPRILDSIGFQIEEGEKIGLLGRNGAGKSTLFRVLQGDLAPDEGEISRQPGLTVAGLQQDVPQGIEESVREYLIEVRTGAHDDQPWEMETAIDRAIRELKLDPEASIATLSAGSKRRVLLAAALVADPDILLLDEPTNHLDIDTIAHLEALLKKRRGSLVFVTHDRSFLRRVATRILELDRGQLRSYSGSYTEYLERRESELEAEATQAAKFDKRLAQEEVWVRQGIRARRTRNEGRVRALLKLREERRARRTDPGRVKAELQEADRSGKTVLKAKNISFAYVNPDGPDRIVRDFSTTILRGDRIGIIGSNGSGKTTLLDLLLHRLEPTNGEVIHGANLEVVKYDQLHDSLDESKSVMENVGEGRDTIQFGAGNRHVVGYLQDFLFSPEQIRGPITKLSGGEKQRLQLAKILSRPSNLLVLDEPTNDLDLETLELLEELLMEFQGTLLLVSHDREFLNNVVTSTIASEGGGVWKEYAGGYDDWLRQTEGAREAARTKKSGGKTRGDGRPDANKVSAGSVGAEVATDTGRPRGKKLSYKETRELESLPDTIESLEAEKDALFTKLASPDFYKSQSTEVQKAKERLEEVQGLIDSSYARWEELEEIREASGR